MRRCSSSEAAFDEMGLPTLNLPPMTSSAVQQAAGDRGPSRILKGV